MSNTIQFYKYQGTGNDFIMLDGREESYDFLTTESIAHLCHRRFGIGADGLIILRNKDGFDFDMDYYNADGKRGSMCGNGGRCTVAFAYDLGIIKDKTRFYAPDGEHEAVFNKHQDVHLKMQNVQKVDEHELGPFMDTGSPHLILFKEAHNPAETKSQGAAIRYNDTYKAVGTNVNFVTLQADSIAIYTYERGVEDATYSCGTGTVAAALAAAKYHQMKSPVQADTLGGQLSVNFETSDFNSFQNIWLNGPAVQVFSGIFAF